MASHSLTERAVPALTGRLRSAPAAWTFLGTGAAAIGLYFLLPSNAQSVFYVVIGFSSVVAIYVGAKRNVPRGERLAWNLSRSACSGRWPATRSSRSTRCS